MAHHMDRAGLAPADGLAVELRLGAQVARETVALRQAGPGTWHFNEPRRAACAPRGRGCADGEACDDDDADSDGDSDDSDDSDSDSDGKKK